MDKYAVFIDAGYMMYVLRKDLAGKKIDYIKLSDHVALPNEMRLRTYYYDCPPFVSATPTLDERERKARFDTFLSKLKRLPRFDVRLGRLKKINNEYEQKMVDVLMAIDLVKLSLEKSIHRAVIFTNDTDFVPAIKIAKDAGVIVDLYRSQHHHNDELLEACDSYTAIDKQMLKYIELKPQK